MKSMLYGYISKNRGALTFSVLCLCVSLMLTYASRNSTGFVQWYGKYISPVFVNTIGRFFSLFPFSVFELILLAAALFLLFLMVGGLFLVIGKSRSLRERFSAFFHKALCILTCLLLVFTLTASVNYSRLPLSAGHDTTVREYSRGELLGLSLLLLDDITELSAVVPRDEQGLLLLDEKDLGATATKGMRELEDRYPSLSGYYPSPKPVFFSEAMSYLGITGIFSPFTMEANYNRDIAAYHIPYTVCHELAHLKGFMREDEAGFIAYLAGINSESTQFRYSSTLNAFLYTLKELYNNVDPLIYNDICLRIPEQVRKEINASRDYWNSHTARVTSIAKKTNDKYLAANAQSQGTMSYDKIVDLLLKEYEHRILDEYGDSIPEYLLDNAESAELN